MNLELVDDRLVLFKKKQELMMILILEFIADDEVFFEEQVSDRKFIDDSTELDEQQPLNYFFKNVERNLEEAALEQSLYFLDKNEDSEPENYYHSKFDKSEMIILTIIFSVTLKRESKKFKN